MKSINYFIENTGKIYSLRVPVKVDGGDTEHLVIIKDKHSNGPTPEYLLTFYDGLDGNFDKQKWTKLNLRYPAIEAKKKFYSNETIIFEGKIRLGPNPEDILGLFAGPCFNIFYVVKTDNLLCDLITVDIGFDPSDLSSCKLDIPGREFKYRIAIDGNKFKYQTIDLENNVLQTDYTDITIDNELYSMLVYYIAENFKSFDTKRVLNELTWTLELCFDDVIHDYIFVYEGMDIDKQLNVDIVSESNEVMIVEVSNPTDEPMKQLISVDVTEFVDSINAKLRVLY